MNEHFGQGALSYPAARDMAGDEFDSWISYFVRWDSLKKLREAQADHDKTMGVIADALKP